jgi:hypothetical protein
MTAVRGSAKSGGWASPASSLFRSPPISVLPTGALRSAEDPNLATLLVGIAVSARSADVRAAQQLSVLGSLPLLVILGLMSLDVITVSTGLAVGLAAALLAVDLLAWRVVAAMFDRERLITGTRT